MELNFNRFYKSLLGFLHNPGPEGRQSLIHHFYIGLQISEMWPLDYFHMLRTIENSFVLIVLDIEINQLSAKLFRVFVQIWFSDRQW